MRLQRTSAGRIKRYLWPDHSPLTAAPFIGSLFVVFSVISFWFVDHAKDPRNNINEQERDPLITNDS